MLFTNATVYGPVSITEWLEGNKVDLGGGNVAVQHMTDARKWASVRADHTVRWEDRDAPAGNETFKIGGNLMVARIGEGPRVLGVWDGA